MELSIYVLESKDTNPRKVTTELQPENDNFERKGRKQTVERGGRH